MALPTSFRAHEMEPLRHYHCQSCHNYGGLLRQHNYRQNLGVYTKIQDLRQVDSRPLCRVRITIYCFPERD